MGSQLPVYWTSTGAPASNQAVSIWFQPTNSNARSALTNSMNVAAIPAGGSIAVPSPLGLTQTTPGYLYLRDDLNPSVNL